MAYQKLQTERAINVFPTTGRAKDGGLLNLNIATIIPDPSKSIFNEPNASGGLTAITTAATGANSNDATFVDDQDWVALNVKPGHIIRITTAASGVATTKFFTIKSVGVASSQTLTLFSGTANGTDNVAAADNSNLFSPARISEYEIFDSEGTEPFVLYVGGAGDVHVLTAGGDEVTFKGVPAGTFIPVQVTKVFTPTSGLPLTTATDIIALR
jgi:hypothetical protein